MKHQVTFFHDRNEKNPPKKDFQEISVKWFLKVLL